MSDIGFENTRRRFERVNQAAERAQSSGGVMDMVRASPDGNDAVLWDDSWREHIGLIPWRVRRPVGVGRGWWRVGGVHARVEIVPGFVGVRFTVPIWTDTEDRIIISPPKWGAGWKDFWLMGEEKVFVWDEARVGWGIYEWMRKCWIRTFLAQKGWLPWRRKECSWRLFGKFTSSGDVESRWDGAKWATTLDEWMAQWDKDKGGLLRDPIPVRAPEGAEFGSGEGGPEGGSRGSAANDDSGISDDGPEPGGGSEGVPGAAEDGGDGNRNAKRQRRRSKPSA